MVWGWGWTPAFLTSSQVVTDAAGPGTTLGVAKTQARAKAGAKKGTMPGSSLRGEGKGLIGVRDKAGQ